MALNTKKYCSNELNNDKQLRLEHRFLVLRKLGQGTYGKVQLALNKETNEEVAVKTIKKAKIENEEDMLRIRREIHIMSSLQHPHIIHIHEVFETRQKIVIVMQYASGGELYDYLGCHQTLPEDEARRIFRQIASAVYYCHKNQICHRDLKLENILLDEEGNAKIADFGLSNVFDDKRRMNTFCGSPLYASPEIVKGTPYKGPEVDCWSLGVLLYTIVYGTMPFDGRSFKELVSQISEGRYEEPIHRSNASSLIRRLLNPDVTQRATIEDVCKDHWINEGYETPLLEVAKNMSSFSGLPKENISTTIIRQEKNSKTDCDKPTIIKNATQIEEKTGKLTSMLKKNFEDIVKTNEALFQKQKPNFYEKILDYDVRFVMNKIISVVEATLKAGKILNNLDCSKNNISTTRSVQKKEVNTTDKVDSAFIIPIFEVTSTIPKSRSKNLGFVANNSENNDKQSASSKPETIKSLTKHFLREKQDQESISENTNVVSQIGEKIMNVAETMHKKDLTINVPSICEIPSKNSQPISIPLTCEIPSKNSQRQIYSLNSDPQHSSTKKCQSRKQQDNLSLHHLPQKNKLGKDNPSVGQKQPISFMRTKHHVATLAKLLSLNYERIMRNSFRMPACKKKLPGKITIPPTFDPNNPTPSAKKSLEIKKDTLIFPSVSVSENKEKIQKKIEKIKKAALDKNLIIRSDSKTRMRIEEYIRSQVKRIQDLVYEEHKSLHGSLENLDEQSLHDLSELYYCTYGSENTDSGIANTEDDEYFCFLCSKLNFEEGISSVLDSFILDSVKKGSLYTSNHLHIPRAKEHDKSFYSLNSMNLEFTSLSKCKSEIQFPNEYLNYISPNNRSDLSKKTSPKQVIQKDNIGNTKCFLTTSSGTAQNIPDLRILRSASDSAGLHLSNNTFDVLKLNTECRNNLAEKYNLLPHLLSQPQSIRGKYFEAVNCETQSTATDSAFMNKSQILDKDDGIGDSNDSFQSYMETPENCEKDSLLTRSMRSQSCTNFTNNNSSTNQLSHKKFFNKSKLEEKYRNEYSDLERGKMEINVTNSSDCATWIGALDDEAVFTQKGEKRNVLKRRNTISYLPNKNKTEEDFDHNNSSNEFENYLWNAYKAQLLQNNENYSEYFSSPNLNYCSFDRKNKFKSHDSKSMDYINGDSNHLFMPKEFYHLTYPAEDFDENDLTFQNVSRHSNIGINHSYRHGNRLNRTKSLCADILTNPDTSDVIQKLRQERKLSCSGIKSESNSPFMSNFLKDIENTDQKRKKNKKRFPTSNMSKNKQSKASYKKSFLQLLALKRIEEAKKELDKAPRTEFLAKEENESNSLLEALKTHGYKTVISQRLQEPDDDVLDSFHMKYLKSPRKLRAQLARLNFMNYDSLPRYTLDPLQYTLDPLQYTLDPLQYPLDTFEENNYIYNDLDYNRNLFSGLPATSYCDTPYDFRCQSKQTAYDCQDITQIDEYINYLKSNVYYNSERSTPTSESRRCCRHREKDDYKSFEDDNALESQNITEDLYSKRTFTGGNTDKEINTSMEINPTSNDTLHSNSFYSDDERQESVHDRIWRKSFYPRFNKRNLFRKERLSFIESETSESRLGFLNRRSPSFKSGHGKYELLQRNGSNKSFHSKPMSMHPSSFDKFESRGSVKKKNVKTLPEVETAIENKECTSNKTFKKISKKKDSDQ